MLWIAWHDKYKPLSDMISKNYHHHSKVESNNLIDPHRNFVLAFQPELLKMTFHWYLKSKILWTEIKVKTSHFY